MILNCATVDDEPLALGLLNAFVEVTPFLNLVHTHSSAQEALTFFATEQLHLIFLDIQMPKLNGIEIAKMLHQLPEENRPKIVFTTAYNQFAFESYQVEALDYLLKPFEYDDFLRSARKALTYYQQLNAIQTPSRPLQDECLFVRVDYQLLKISWDDIRYIEGLKDYVKIYLNNSEKPVLTLATLKSLDEKLPSDRFMRVQRSFIVAFDKISAITKNSVWIGEIEITIGEQYKDTLQQLMNKWL
ncbi:DNA-binding response regulator [Pedobacter chinensis]|uniref:DNA-binding response regulator n=1 Tax=Pedobacter chinensis TaxID=2282421 RepID=A0A369PSD1_9SPHI|nr:LytTR family DNA-binding domain-containing protein [Pedobacter chinensis]RDC55170.1 DNA-binding response regulator [Pedobacter chinensis]